MITPTVASAVQAFLAIAETIQGVKEVPSGHLYARVMDHLSLEEYQGIIAALKRAKLVKERNHLLTWIGKELS